MSKLIFLKGLPASGKSTWAKAQVKANPTKVKRVNKDDIRRLIHGGIWQRAIERDVEKIEEEVAAYFLDKGCTVIVDDTNFHPKHADRFKELAKAHGASFEGKMFHVELKDAIERDLKRPEPVGEAVIRRMWTQFLKPKPLTYKHDMEKVDAILCDLDGTLADLNGRDPYGDPSNDLPHWEIIGIVNRFSKDFKVILMSGRKEKFRKQTKQWLKDHGVRYDELFMRADEDNRKDSVTKWEMFEEKVDLWFNIKFVLDDRQQVVDMWRSKGLICLQVAEGDF